MKILNQDDINFVFGTQQSIVDSFLPSCLLNKKANQKAVKAKDIVKFNISDYEGKTFYMVPWSLHVNENGEYFVDFGHAKQNEKFGTAEMRVTVKDGMVEIILPRDKYFGKYTIPFEGNEKRIKMSCFEAPVLVSKKEFYK